MNKLKITHINILFMFVFFTIYALQLLVVIFAKKVSLDYTNTFNLAISISEYIGILLVILLYSVKKGYDLKQVFRLNSIKLIQVILIVVIAFATWAIATFLNLIILIILSELGMHPVGNDIVVTSKAEFLYGIFFICMTPAICEEMLCRGILLKAYENRGTISAIVISAILFGLIHNNIQNLIGPIFIGIVSGYIVIKSNSIFSGITLHFVFNFISMCILYLQKDYGNPISDTSATNLVQAGAALFILFIFAYIILYITFNVFNRITDEINGKKQVEVVFRSRISNFKNEVLSVITHYPILIIILFFIVTNFILKT